MRAMTVKEGVTVDTVYKNLNARGLKELSVGQNNIDYAQGGDHNGAKLYDFDAYFALESKANKKDFTPEQNEMHGEDAEKFRTGRGAKDPLTDSLLRTGMYGASMKTA